VVWHTFVAHHVVRSEDWPVMPAATAGFKIRPDGFFDGNPSLDVPEPAGPTCGHDAASAGAAEVATDEAGGRSAGSD
jgi:primary-amine oxidase